MRQRSIQPLESRGHGPGHPMRVALHERPCIGEPIGQQLTERAELG